MSVNYSFTNQSSDGSLVFRSTVNSFGLDHATDKDIASFYTSFSSLSYIDTGLLPVDGSGLLSVRSAGHHTQIAYQHKPGMYYINWGKYEGDSLALKYFVAQPYRIVIADLLNGNILGARTFYSPIPITHPLTPLYHVNLPNINCKGYRGNGVGWICLYHNEDISSYPFNEKLAKILDRCSGTEAYNDANMNETDGPRFYSEKNKPSYIFDPVEWQAYSEQNGYEWTLDPDLWIPILVKDRDHQDKHYDSGQPLTFLDAITGNYQAYYTDSLIPKPVNAILRSDISLSSETIFNWFKQAYNSSSSSLANIDPYQNSSEVRASISIASPSSSFNEEDDDSSWICDSCGESFDEDDEYTSINNEHTICNSCRDEYYGYAYNTQQWHHLDDLLWVEHLESHIHYASMIDNVDYKICQNCGTVYHKTYEQFDTIITTDDGWCIPCFDSNTSASDSLPF